MALTINTKSYTNDSQRTVDIIRYVGPDHDGSANDYCDLKRTLPKPTTTSDGKSKGSIKMTRLLSDGTDPLGDAIIETSISYPVGADSTELAALITDHSVYVATTSASDLLVDRKINQ
jgi:hypothetical protein